MIGRRRKDDGLVCLDYSLGRLSAIEVRNGEVVAWASYPLPAGIVRNGDPVEAEQLGLVIREVLLGAGITAQRARLALPDEASVTRVIELPKMRRGDLRRAIGYLVEKEVPFPVARASWDWDLVRTDGARSIVCLAAAWRDVVERARTATTHAGLKVEIVEPRSLSVSRALGLRRALIFDASPQTMQLTLLLESRAPYVDQMPVVGARREVADRLLQRALRHANENGGLGAAPPLVLAGELEGSSREWVHLLDAGVQTIDASNVLNGYRPTRPPQIPAGFYLSGIGLAMR